MRRITNGTRIRCCGLALLLMTASQACNQGETPPAGSGQAAEVPAQSPPTSFSPAQLDELVAPIALYPDTLLAQVLAASTNAQEVLDAGNWLLQNQSLKGEALENAANEAGFGPSVQGLVHFPTVMDMMCQQLDWTTRLGEAFAADQGAVLASVQRLRAQAVAMGNLTTTPEQKVESTEVKDDTGSVKQVVTVAPAQPQVVYVPQYNPQQVYTTPAPASNSSDSGISSTEAVLGGLMAFGLGVVVGNAFDDDDDCCYPNWGGGGVYYGGNRYSNNTVIYAPNYGGNFRPATGYRRPNNYPYSYDRARGARNSTANLDQNDYFNRFQGSQARPKARPEAGGLAATREARPGNRPVGEYKGAKREGTPDLQRAAAREAGASARPSSSAYAGKKTSKQGGWNGTGTGADLGHGRDASAGRAGLSAKAPAKAKAKPTATARAKPAVKKQTDGAAGSMARSSKQGHPQIGALSGNRSGMNDRVASSRGRASSAGRDHGKARGGGGGGLRARR